MTEAAFEPMENNLSLFLYGTRRSVDGVSLAEAIELSGARIIGIQSLGPQRVFLLEESHVYIAEGEDTIFQLCTCGRTCPPDSVASLMRLYNPSSAAAVYFRGVPLVSPQLPFDLRSRVPGWSVDVDISRQGEVFVAKRNEPGGFFGEYTGLSLKRCFDLHPFDTSSLRAPLLSSLLDRVGMKIRTCVEHEFNPGYTGVFLGDEGCVAVHTTPEYAGSFRGLPVNFASVHVHGKGVDVSSIIDFFDAQFADVFTISSEGYKLEERIKANYLMNA